MRGSAVVGQPRRSGPAVQRILTVCGNGVGTSLFLKNTLERVLERWGWEQHVTVEATDTVSARGARRPGPRPSSPRARSPGSSATWASRCGSSRTSPARREVDAVLRDTYDV